MNRFGAAASTATDLDLAIAEACDAASAQLQGDRPSLALVFVTHHHRDGFDRVGRAIRARTRADRLLGCSGDGIVAGSREIEGEPCVAVWLASFPEGEVEAFALDVEEQDDAIRVQGFPGIGASPERAAGRVSVLLLGEPFSFPADLFLQQLDENVPGLAILGGMASGGRGPGQNALFLDDDCVRAGAVGAILRGIAVRHVVSQGCRPVGKSMVITKAHANVIEELAGKPPLEQLRRAFEEGDADEKALITKATRGGGLHIGQVVDERISQPRRGDFLVRSVFGADPKSGEMQIGDQARRGRTVRFHVRDAASADDDLRQLLRTAREAGDAAGALVFTCNGRGRRFFPAADHDAGCVQELIGAPPAAGFFCAGEIGPIGGRNFLHGFTASIALFAAE